MYVLRVAWDPNGEYECYGPYKTRETALKDADKVRGFDPRTWYVIDHLESSADLRHRVAT